MLSEEFNLLPNFSGPNILLVANQELIVLHFFLLTPVVSLLLVSFFLIFYSSSWSYGPTFHIHSKSYFLPFLCQYLLHLGLSLDLFNFLLDLVHLALLSYIPH